MTRSATILALLFLAEPALAQWEPPDDVLQVRVKGDGDWHLTCKWQDSKGRSQTKELAGRNGDWERLHIRRPVSGTCSYQAAAGHTLTVRLKSPLFQCTLPQPGGDGCEQTFLAGGAGQFAIAARD